MKKLLCLLFILSTTVTPIYAAPEALTRGQTRDMIFAAASKYNDGLQATDIMTGYEDGSLKENQSATRLEMLLMLSRAFGAFPTPKGDNLRRAAGVSEYTDAPSWAKSAIDNLNGGLLLVPSEDKLLRPSEAAMEKELDLYLRRIWALYGTRLEDDFYAYVNKEFLDTTELSAENDRTGVMWETVNKSDAQMKAILDEILSGKWEKGTTERKIVDYYNSALDIDAQNKIGAAPLKPYLDQLAKVKTIAELNAALLTLASDTVCFPYIKLQLQRDHLNGRKFAVYMSSPYTISLPRNFIETTTEIFTIAGVSSPEETAKSAADIITRLSENREDIPDMPELSYYDTILSDKPVSSAEAKALAPNADMDSLLAAVGLKAESEYYLRDDSKAKLKALSALYTDENASALAALAQYELINKYKRDMGGLFTEAGGMKPTTEQLIELTLLNINRTFQDFLAPIYVKRYVSEQAKSELTKMTNIIVESYKDNVRNLNWMSDATKETAIKKLDNMAFQIAYPDKFGNFHDTLNFRGLDEGGSYQEYQIAIQKAIMLRDNANQGKPNEKVVSFDMFYSAAANASREENGVNVCAGLLMPPIYNPDASTEENIACVGWIIAHEITHNFDPSGARYDENGGLNDWWTAEDKAKYTELCKSVTDYYAGMEFAPGLVRAEFEDTIDENSADLGGFSSALAALKKLKPNPDYKLFFKSAARMWRETMTRDKYVSVGESDSHSAGRNRANLVFKTMPEFYETFNIKPGDGMYIAPENRVKVW